VKRDAEVLENYGNLGDNFFCGGWWQVATTISCGDKSTTHDQKLL
jgi:hypothetical protein